MKKALENLMREHDAILSVLNILETIIQRWEDRPGEYAKDISTVLSFLEEFSEKCHHGKEEGILFPAMEKNGVLKYDSPLGEILREHEEGRRFIREMLGSLKNLNDEIIPFEEEAENFISLIRNHITRENTVLFPLAESKIPPESISRIEADFDAFEEITIGKKRHEEWTRRLAEFEKKYLS